MLLRDQGDNAPRCQNSVACAADNRRKAVGGCWAQQANPSSPIPHCHASRWHRDLGPTNEFVSCSAEGVGSRFRKKRLPFGSSLPENDSRPRLPDVVAGKQLAAGTGTGANFFLSQCCNCLFISRALLRTSITSRRNHEQSRCSASPRSCARRSVLKPAFRKATPGESRFNFASGRDTGKWLWTQWMAGGSRAGPSAGAPSGQPLESQRAGRRAPHTGRTGAPGADRARAALSGGVRVRHPGSAGGHASRLAARKAGPANVCQVRIRRRFRRCIEARGESRSVLPRRDPAVCDVDCIGTLPRK
jgi:hypothetical protein